MELSGKPFRHRDGRAFARKQSEQLAWGRSAWLLFIFILLLFRFRTITLLAVLLSDRITGKAGDEEKRMIARRCFAVLHRPFQKLPQLVDGLAQDPDLLG